MLLAQAHFDLHQVLNLSSFDVFDFLFQEHFSVVFFHRLQEGVDSGLEVVRAVFARLNHDSATKNLRIGTKTGLNDIAKLFVGPKRIETRLLQASEQDSEQGGRLVSLLTLLEIYLDTGVWISARNVSVGNLILLDDIVDRFIRQLNHLVKQHQVIVADLTMLNTILSLLTNPQSLLLIQMTRNEPLEPQVAHELTLKFDE